MIARGNTALWIGLLLLAAESALGQSPPPPPGDAGAPQGALVDVNQPGRWPMIVSSPEGQITVFQPQLDDFQGDHLSARSAVSVERPQQAATFGAVWFESRVNTDRVSRTVLMVNVNITRSRFPGADPATEQALGNTVRQAINSQPVTLSLDQLLAMLQTVQKDQNVATNLQTAPPAIVFRDHPTVKVQYDGQPRMVQVEGTPLLRVANTPFFVVLDSPSKTYFLKGGGRWYAAPDPMGPFRDVAYVPQAVSQLANATDYTDPQQAIQAANIEIMTATEPTELIWTDGQPQMGTVPGTDLLYVTNSPSDMFLQIETQQLYVLLSGRWYVAPNRNGPWSYVPPDRLPPDFARIPTNSDKGDVLAHIAGTQASAEAVADTFVPQTATIARTHFDQPVIHYDGDPRFDAIEGLPVQYCVNTDAAVVTVRGRYYSCYNGVWYLAGAPVGPWDLCTEVPVEVYQLPPTCPIYSVRYCRVYGFTPDVVYCGYTPGYMGCYAYDRVVVYGTGYRYAPWVGRAYYPRPWTFGFAARYNGYVGQWGFSFGLAAGTGGARWVGEGPRSWGREGLWFGFGGYRPVIRHEDVHVDIFRSTYLNRVRPEDRGPQRTDVYVHNVYERRNDVHIETPARGLVAPREIDRGFRAGETAGGRRPETPVMREPDRAAGRGSESRNDVFADRQGNVYRKTLDGWETRDGNQWRDGSADRGPENARPIQSPAREEVRGRSNETPVRDTPTVRETPTARDERTRVTEPARDERTRVPEPSRQAPTVSRGTSANERVQSPRGEESGRSSSPELNRDYRSRISGDERLRNYERTPSRTDAPSRSDSPARSTPSRGETPSRSDSSGRSDSSSRSDNSSRSTPPSRSDSPGRSDSSGGRSDPARGR